MKKHRLVVSVIVAASAMAVSAPAAARGPMDLFVGNGVIQGIEPLELLGSLLLTDRTVVHQATQPDASPTFRLRLRPIRIAGGYGMTAYGTF